MTDHCECYAPVPLERSRAFSSTPSFWGRIVGVVTNLLTCLYVWQERAATRKHLAAMDDHMLKDIGLSHADVHRESRKPFWQA